MNDVIIIERPLPHVALVTINRPEARNAINRAVAVALEAAVYAVEADSDVWAVVLTGTGDNVFCAGADLKEIANGNLDGLSTARSGFGGFVHATRTKPWIAAVEGLALAGGCEIALACDMIVASQNGGFGLPEVSRGLAASAGGLYRLPRALPQAIAIEMILTGKRLAADHALAFGMINSTAPSGEVAAAAIRLAEAIVQNAPLAVRESLRIARATFDLATGDLQQMSEAAQSRLALTADFTEGPKAFIE